MQTNFLKDYHAHTLLNLQEIMKELGEQEKVIQQAKKNKEKDKEEEAQKKAEKLRNQLLESGDITAIYHYLNAKGIANANNFRAFWQKKAVTRNMTKTLKDWGINSFYLKYWDLPSIELSFLPLYSFVIQFTFTLAKPFLSRDDNEFYIIDNPIVRDKLFTLPMIRPSSWKGNLRTTLWYLGYRYLPAEGFANEQVKRMFGQTPSEEDECNSQGGRLIFFPAFFKQTSLEIINPHDRKTRTGKNPILYECVPKGAKATFSLLYLPYDLLGREDISQDKIHAEAKEDLKLIAEAIAQMMLTYGFSAKRTSGYGMAEDKIIDGMIKTHADERPLKGKELHKLAEEAEHVRF